MYLEGYEHRIVIEAIEDALAEIQELDEVSEGVIEKLITALEVLGVEV